MANKWLRVVYHESEDGPEINTALDKALEKVLGKFGYTRWASGVELVPPYERDLAFERVVGREDAIPSKG